MDRTVTEKKIVVLLFVFVIVLFSFAQNDTQKLKQLYTQAEKTVEKLVFIKSLGALIESPDSK